MHRTRSKLEECEKALKIRFRNRKLLEKALTHSSRGGSVDSHNERLEFLGDSVLELVTTEYLYHHFPGFREGQLSRIRSSVVSRETLAQITIELGLHEHCLVGNCLKNKEKLPTSVLANLYEAVVGAIYLDQGYERAKEFILTHLSAQIEKKKNVENSEDYKSRLQIYCQRQFGTIPTYQLIGESGPEHDKLFTVAVSVNGQVWGTGQGKSKKKAEQKAAQVTLQQLEQQEEPVSIKGLQEETPPSTVVSFWKRLKGFLRF